MTTRQKAMLGLDTNVVIRQLTQDDPVQSPMASHLFERIDEQIPAYISVVVTIEIAWVLKRAYGQSNTQIAHCFALLLATSGLQLQCADAINQTVVMLNQNPKLGFADCLIHLINQQAGCTLTYTFDQGAAQHAGMLLLTSQSNQN